MNGQQKLNYKGVYKEYNPRGYEITYNIGDVVEHDGKRYIAILRNSKSTPSIKNSSWRELSGDFEDYHYSDSQPLNANVGDRWVDRVTGRMYTYIEDKNGFHWVEF